MSHTVDKLNVILANANVLFTKLHNYHWNVKGAAFFQLHAKTEAYYNQFATMYDDVAERILQIGGMPLVTLKQILATATIKEEERTEFTIASILESVEGDFEIMQKLFAELAADESVDSITSAYADEQNAMLEKELWMLRASKSQ